MKSELQLIEDYIDYYGDREFVNSLTYGEQVLYKCQVRGSISFVLFKVYMRLKELFNKEMIFFK